MEWYYQYPDLKPLIDTVLKAHPEPAKRKKQGLTVLDIGKAIALRCPCASALTLSLHADWWGGDIRLWCVFSV